MINLKKKFGIKKDSRSKNKTYYKNNEVDIDGQLAKAERDYEKFLRDTED